MQLGGWSSFFRCRGGGRRRRNRGEEGRQHGDILTFTDGITDENIPSVILPVKGSRHYMNLGLNPSIISSVKSLAKTSTSSTYFFFKILNILSVILSVYTDRITEGFTFVGNYHRKLPTEKFCR